MLLVEAVEGCGVGDVIRCDRRALDGEGFIITSGEATKRGLVCSVVFIIACTMVQGDKYILRVVNGGGVQVASWCRLF